MNKPTPLFVTLMMTDIVLSAIWWTHSEFWGWFWIVMAILTYIHAQWDKRRSAQPAEGK